MKLFDAIKRAKSKKSSDGVEQAETGTVADSFNNVIHMDDFTIVQNNGFECGGENGTLTASTPDSWILAKTEQPVKYIIVATEINSSFYVSGDYLTIYYQDGLADDFSESRKVTIPLNESTSHRVVLPCASRFFRFDITERAGVAPLEHLAVLCPESQDTFYRHFFPSGDGNGIVLLTHDLTNTGAPLLASHIARQLVSLGRTVVCLYLERGDGSLVSTYRSFGVEPQPLYCSDEFNAISKEARQFDSLDMLRWLNDNGYRSAILNTVVSGACAGMFKRAGFVITTLIHETADVMRICGWVSAAIESAAFSDSLVFPCEYTENDFREVVGDIRGRTLIKHQGLYIEAVQAKQRDSAKDLFGQMGIQEHDMIILGSGTATLRKGIDLFVDSCIAYSAAVPETKRPQFIWIGDGSGDILEWLQVQINRSGYASNIHIIPFVEPGLYKAVLNEVDAFWSTSRVDTYPSVVLEAMAKGLPVFGFAGASGVDSILADGRGVLIDDFSADKLAVATRKYLDSSNLRDEISHRSRQWIKDNFSFVDYVEYLEDICALSSIVDPMVAELDVSLNRQNA